MTAEERLEQLKILESKLVMDLHETQYMIKGYQSALETKEEKEPEPEEV
jgi:hypothetical protein